MKNLKEYIKEEIMTGGSYAAPSNVIGISNVSMPNEPNVIGGSGDIPQPLCIDIKTGKLYKRRKRFKRYKI